MILDYGGDERIPPDSKGGIVEFGVRGAQFVRLNGSTNVIYIGRTGTKESLRGFFESLEPSRSMWWLRDKGYEFDVRWCPLPDELVKDAFQYRLNSYMAEHWEQPSGHRIPGGTDPTATRKGLQGLGPIMASYDGDVWSDWYQYLDEEKFSSEYTSGPPHLKPPGSWSDWYPLTPDGMGKKLPESRYGIYEISMHEEFPRFRGRSGTVNIGMAGVMAGKKRGQYLTERLKDKLRSGPGIPGGWSGTMKWLAEDDPNITFKGRWFPEEGYRSGQNAERAENWRILEYLACHLEMPPGQPKPPAGHNFIR
jgi:hypothetical protein